MRRPIRLKTVLLLAVVCFLGTLVLLVTTWNAENLPSAAAGIPLRALLPSALAEGFYDEKALLKLGEVNTQEDAFKKKQGYKLYEFNAFISDKLSYTRPIPDSRHSSCPRSLASNGLPKTSIIICFYNEALSVLLRTLRTILHRSPLTLIQEIILIDDQSIVNLHHHLVKVPFVRVIRPEKKLGLVKARILGAEQAKGEALLFLDSHVEVNVGWLQPLLAHIRQNPKSLAVPLIDIIEEDTFAYKASPYVRGGFNWGLFFKWDGLSPNSLQSPSDYARPYATPTMAGGLFAVDKHYFQVIGSYDDGMETWGGENLEISFRVWTCGGRIDIVPCSRVGHIFRRKRPYGEPTGRDSWLWNTLRMAHVWLDGYIEQFYLKRPSARNAEFGDVSKRIALRKQLGCKPFVWYLKNVYPEMYVELNNKDESLHRAVRSSGRLLVQNTKLCVRLEMDSDDGELQLSTCNEHDPLQLAQRRGRYQFQVGKLCLSVMVLSSKKLVPRGMPCAEDEVGEVDQQWTLNSESGGLLQIQSGLCLAATLHVDGAPLVMDACPLSSSDAGPGLHFKFT